MSDDGFWRGGIAPSRPLTAADFAYVLQEREAILEAGHLALGFPHTNWLDSPEPPAFELTGSGFVTREAMPLRKLLRFATAAGLLVPEEWRWCHKQ